MNTRVVLKQLKTGRIELVFTAGLLRVEFNTSCLEALPYCKAICCRQRVGYSIELEPEELEKFKHVPNPRLNGSRILPAAPNKLDCLYLDSESSKCLVHHDKPQMCRKWHCSPGGEKGDKNIERRDAGWLLMPMRKEEAELIQIQTSATK